MADGVACTRQPALEGGWLAGAPLCENSSLVGVATIVRRRRQKLEDAYRSYAVLFSAVCVGVGTAFGRLAHSLRAHRLTNRRPEDG